MTAASSTAATNCFTAESPAFALSCIMYVHELDVIWLIKPSIEDLGKVAEFWRKKARSLNPAPLRSGEAVRRNAVLGPASRRTKDRSVYCVRSTTHSAPMMLDGIQDQT
jgi:hypothetical protein